MTALIIDLFRDGWRLYLTLVSYSIRESKQHRYSNNGLFIFIICRRKLNKSNGQTRSLKVKNITYFGIEGVVPMCEPDRLD